MNRTGKPGIFDQKGRAKWTAWDKVKGATPYLAILSRMCSRCKLASVVSVTLLVAVLLTSILP